MITATVRLAVGHQRDGGGVLPSFSGPAADKEIKLTAVDKEDIRENVRAVVHAHYGLAASILSTQSGGTNRSIVAETLGDVLGETQHISHIEWSDGTSEALIIPVDLTTIARSTVVSLVHRKFNQGVLGSSS